MALCLPLSTASQAGFSSAATPLVRIRSAAPTPRNELKTHRTAPSDTELHPATNSFADHVIDGRPQFRCCYDDGKTFNLATTVAFRSDTFGEDTDAAIE